MKTVRFEDASLDRCVSEAQKERVLLTRDGHPVALVVGVDGMDEEQVQLSSSPEFWKLIEESRRQKTISREEARAEAERHQLTQ
jgi:antitoxin (DNA-binding transcriptional repressor) of toxin-antitoxin stability system